MDLDALLPFVLPSVKACPDVTARHHIRLAAQEFCRRAHVWKEDLDTLLADGYRKRYAVALDDQVEIAQLLRVKVTCPGQTEGERVHLVDPDTGREYVDCNRSEWVCWTDDRRTLSFNFTPVVDSKIDGYVALQPALTAFSLPDHVFAHHAEGIAAGALKRLFAMNDVAWRNETEALRNDALFNDAIGAANLVAGKGAVRGRRRSKMLRF